MNELEIKELSEKLIKNSVDFQAKVKELGEKKLESSDFKAYEEKNLAEFNKLKDEIAALKVPKLSATEVKSENIEKSRAAVLNWMRKGVLDNVEVKVLTIGDPASGGYLSTPEYVAEITKGVIEFSPVRSLATVRQTSQHTVEFPKETGQPTCAWISESGTKAETTGTAWGKDTLTPHECYALIDISNQNLEDSAFNLEAEVSDILGRKFGVLEGTAFVSGNGVGQPEGITANATVAASYKTTSSTSANFTALDCITAYYALKSEYAKSSTWGINRAIVGHIRKFTDGTTGQFLWMPGMLGNPDTLLGRPIVEMTDMASAVASSAVVAILGDFKRGYKIVDRIGMTIQRDPYTQNTAGNVRFLARKRVDGKVVLPEAFRLLACGA